MHARNFDDQFEIEIQRLKHCTQLLIWRLKHAVFSLRMSDQVLIQKVKHSFWLQSGDQNSNTGQRKKLRGCCLICIHATLNVTLYLEMSAYQNCYSFIDALYKERKSALPSLPLLHLRCFFLRLENFLHSFRRGYKRIVTIIVVILQFFHLYEQTPYEK